ncbi:group II intron maturase-specific domain-containing protein [Bradyrhizobium sp.]|uniref:group II intron maturase-specific domain-containing protein n=1 Tax=Bradyrhizobium sp. TaxID=376 RepID=UPI0025B8B26A|nr:group II intron maturase-specific domain-containing protein [Bradyrhizobium sp.]
MDEGGDDQAWADTQRVKTSLRNARQERFDFLGYSFGVHWFEANGKRYLGASPSKKSVQRLKTRVGELLVPSNIDPWPEVRDKLNRSLRGWSNYFGYGSRSKACRSVDQYVFELCADSSREGTRCKGAAIADSYSMSFIENSAFCASNACPEQPRRAPRGEASRKAGCRKSARPV